MRPSAPLLALTACGGLLAAAPALAGHWLDGEETLPGLRVAGAPLPPTGDPAAALAPRAEAWLEEEIALRAGPALRVIRRREAGASIDVGALGDALLARGRGSLRERLVAWNEARRGRVDLAWPVTVDEDRARALVEAVGAAVDRPPVVAEFSPAGRVSTEPQDGLALDREAALAHLVAAVRVGAPVAELPVARTPPEVVPPPSARPAFDTLLSTYTSRFGGGRGRAHNVRRAAALLDGAVLPPGGALSFNDAVGPRDLASDFRIAPEIVGGEMVDGVGGGTCQVASTLHAAAFLGGLEVLDHVPHSRPAGYVPLGLDATVVWPNVDLVLQNPYPFPLLVRATTEGRRLTVDLLGSGEPFAVEWSRRVLERQEFEDRRVEDPSVPPGGEVVTQEGIPGYRVRRLRVIDRGAGPQTEARILRYPPTDRIVRVAPAVADAAPVPPVAPLAPSPW